ncbi:MAG: pyridoxamine 5'-phosphate oxidase family protein [Nitrospirae bacterium]|nr:pyridoxamine 5'-phosphate oxidase family protein [Nitrospirota bacterium]
MIPEKLVEFLHGPVYIGVGTRDERLRPLHTWAMGMTVAADRKALTLFIPDKTSGRMLENLKHNGKVAVGVGSPVNNENYQLKGEFATSRPTEPGEAAIQEIYRTKLLTTSIQAGYPEAIIKPLVMGFAYKPSLAVTVIVKEIYLQTPGPEAGKKMA